MADDLEREARRASDSGLRRGTARAVSDMYNSRINRVPDADREQNRKDIERSTSTMLRGYAEQARRKKVGRKKGRQ